MIVERLIAMRILPYELCLLHGDYYFYSDI